ncbi:hypothetical protein IAR55_004395 [Kwoniella newhampshirensis]|uniref:Histone deacetylase domain-containing protein n=1 Tax=Kwoniella newhampshirensis TaxID=1651941 RepID=A0AAW0YXM3_9TREE
MPSRSQLPPLGLFIQPACLQHKYIRHANSSHIFERPERLRAVLLGVAAAVARLEEAAASTEDVSQDKKTDSITPSTSTTTTGDDLSGMLSSLSIGAGSAFLPATHISIVSPPSPLQPGSILLHHPAVQIAHSPTPEAPFPYLGQGSSSSSGGSASFPTSPYLKDLFKWASEAAENIKETGCEIPQGLGLNAGDLYLGPGSILAIEGAIQTVCQAVDCVTRPPVAKSKIKPEPTTPPGQKGSLDFFDTPTRQTIGVGNPTPNKAFCAIRPPGHHCGEDAPSGFCYVNNVVVGALHGYLQHDIDRAIIIDFDLHHGNGTQALVMPLNAAAHADDLQVKAGKPAMMLGKDGRRRRGWKGFYGSVHDIYSYPCEDGDIDLIKDASISLAAHGQYIENIHLQPYADEADFYARIYPLYLALLNKAKVFMEQTDAESNRTMVFISAGFDACEHEHQGMQRHDRRVPTSFYSRYTTDIVAFADQYTEGKVVSVLEGGYSDRALTSAAMGHIVGMTGSLPEKCDEWWSETELVNIEKATKKKRTGKLQPFPSDLSSHSHLLRTHALLGHFESIGVPEAAAPSVTSTPQTVAARMTLRDRSRKVDDSAPASTESTPAIRRPARGRGAGASVTTPTARSKDARATVTTPTAAAKVVKAATPSERKTSREEDVGLPQSKSDGFLLKKVEVETKVDVVEPALLQGLAGVSLRGDCAEREAVPSERSKDEPAGLTHQEPVSVSASIPKIILRIPRPNPSPPASIQESPLSFAAIAQHSVYPILPPPASSTATTSAAPRLSSQQRMAYREGSASASDADAEGETDTEYVSAQSGLEEDRERGTREGTTASGSSLSSSGLDMPGGFGR